MFRFTAVSKSFDGRLALTDVSLVTPDARTTAIIGPSGCGKTTVLGLMTGLLMPDSGVVDFEGLPLTKARLPLIRRRIGYVIQDGGLFPHLTGLGNVTLMSRHIGWERARIRQRVEELAALAQLSSGLLSRYPAEMSGGQRQRVSLMRALMLDPGVLLLDEPLAALDPMVRAELQDDLADIFRRLKKTVVIVTHDISEAAFFADQIILMRAGAVVQAGTTDELFDDPADGFVRHFLRAQQSRMLVRRPS